MRYHADTLALAGIVAHQSPDNLAEILALEMRIGHRLPESFRELVTSDVYPLLLKTFSNSDDPIEPRELGGSFWRYDDEPPPGVLQFMYENQGVARWGIESNSLSDPRVLVQVDAHNDPPWRLCAETFSLWLRCLVLDSQLLDRALYAAQAEQLTATVRDELHLRFAAGPKTFGWPGATNYRFSHDLGDLLLWDGKDQCDWWVAPATVESAPQLLEHLPLPPDAAGWFYELRPEGAAALVDWQRGSRKID